MKACPNNVCNMVKGGGNEEGQRRKGRGRANMHLQNKGLAPRDHNEHQEF